ncbi:transketolase family protein [Propionivibrio soli]|jgi:transketolase|uniref:transketolase family protein n=1 Tax=Propionivibrio soli TaxID=2976531 RepID=UPI0021E6F23C|nr:transketolase C-terminal domain-containing protein [Propionivibrio soli]
METKSLRLAYGEALVEEGRANTDIVVLEADLGKSTMSCLFKDAYPERYFEMGIAEQNMASTAAGMALAGKVPFYSTFAVFAAGRAYDQIRCAIAIPEANVRICGSSCGLSDFGDGKTHQSVEDANIMCSIPNMTVLNPCDAVETRKMVRAMLSHKGPVYIRINRNELPVYTAADTDYEIGRMYRIRKGSDVVIFATGSMVWKSMLAADLLEAAGISAEVVNVSSLKPLRKEEILKYTLGKKAIVTAEEANRIGGLGCAIAGLIIGEVHLPFAQVAIDDQFGTSAYGYDELLERYGLTERHIAEAACGAIAKRAIRH